MSHSKPPATMRSTVRQAPFTLIDSPSSRGASEVSMNARATGLPARRLRTPVVSTRPVNI